MIIITYGDLNVGTEVLIIENGKFTPYIIVHKGLPSSLYDSSCNGVWLLRKYLDQSNWGWSESRWEYDGLLSNYVSVYKNDYAKSEMHKKLNADFLQRFDKEWLPTIKDVKIPYRSGCIGKEIKSLHCKVFLLSGQEVGWSESDNDELPKDGAKLNYFLPNNSEEAKAQRIALTESNEAFWWWLRSPYLHTTREAWLVREDGLHRPANSDGVTGIRPCMIVNPNSECVSINYL